MRARAGPFFAAAGVQTDKTVGVAEGVLQRAERRSCKPVPADELARAKNYVALRYPERASKRPATSRGGSRTCSSITLPDDYFSKYVQNIQAVTAADVQRVAQKYIQPGHVRRRRRRRSEGDRAGRPRAEPRADQGDDDRRGLRTEAVKGGMLLRASATQQARPTTAVRRRSDPIGQARDFEPTEHAALMRADERRRRRRSARPTAVCSSASTCSPDRTSRRGVAAPADRQRRTPATIATPDLRYLSQSRRSIHAGPMSWSLSRPGSCQATDPAARYNPPRFKERLMLIRPSARRSLSFCPSSLAPALVAQVPTASDPPKYVLPPQAHRRRRSTPSRCRRRCSARTSRSWR